MRSHWKISSGGKKNKLSCLLCENHMEESMNGSRECSWPGRGERLWWLTNALTDRVIYGVDFEGRVIGPAVQWDAGCD